MEKSINTKLKEARISKNISAQEVADYLGMSLSNYCRLEKNKIKLNVDTLIKFCDFLKIDPKLFFEDKSFNSEAKNNFVQVPIDTYKTLSKAQNTLTKLSKDLFKYQKA